MARLIQNEDIKSAADLVAAGGTAAQLPNDDKIWITANGLNETLYDAIVNGDIGGGGGGGGGSAMLTGWTPFTQTIGAATTPPTLGTTTTNQSYWRRVGDSIEVQGVIYQTSAGSSGSGAYFFDPPSPHIPDVTKNQGLALNANVGAVIGNGSIYSNSGGQFDFVMGLTTTGHVVAYNIAFNAPLGSALTSIGASSSWQISYHYIVPIVGWSAQADGGNTAAVYSWAGYHDQSVANWNFDSTGSFADPSSNSSNGNAIVEVDNNNFGTVTSYASGARKLPGIVFTPPAIGRYRVSATISVLNPPSAAHFGVFQLTDGTTVIDEATAIGAVGGELVLTGIINITSLSSTTIKIQAQVSTATAVISTTGVGQSMVRWAIEAVNASVEGAASNTAKYHYDTTAGHASTNTGVIYFVNNTQSSDPSSLLTVVNSSTLGMKITANRRCRIWIGYSWVASSTYFGGVSKNSTQLTTSAYAVNKADTLSLSVSAGDTSSMNAPTFDIAEAGDFYHTMTETTATVGSTPSRAVLYVVAEEIIGTNGSIADVATYLYPNSATMASTNTAIPYYGSAITSQDAGGLLSVVNSTTLGLSATALKPCMITMSFPMSYGSGNYKGISKNSNQLSTDVSSITAAHAVAINFSATNTIAFTTVTIPMAIGDVLRPHLVPGIGALNSYMLIITAQKLVAAGDDPVFVGARYTTCGTFIDGTGEVLNFSASDYDSHGAVTTGAAWKFTAPVDGKYTIDFHIEWSGTPAWSTNNAVEVWLRKNGTTLQTIYGFCAQTSSSFSLDSHGTGTIRLVAGDYIDIMGYTSRSGGLTGNSSAQYTWIAISKIG